MTQLGTSQRTPVRANRAGYVLAAAINAAGLLLVHLWPGWESVPFLTEETASVLWIVDAALVVGILVNVVFLLRDPGWPTAAGSLVTTLMSLAAMIRVLQVFPFEFDAGTSWAVVVRVVLIVGIVGACLGVVALVVSLLRLRLVQRR